MPKATVTQPVPTPSTVTVIPQSLDSALLAMNEEFCFIERLPGIAILPTPDDPELHIYSRGEFVQAVCSDRVVKQRNVADAWMKWDKRRKVRNLTYAPGKPQIYENQLNTWVPSRVTPRKGNVDLWLKYLDHVFESDPSNREWFVAWLAYQFQYPGTKLHTATLFWSEETGTGKSLFGYVMAELFGAHNFSEISEGDLHGSFNFWAARKQFIMGEEIKGANAQRHADALKAIITRKTVTINTKNTPHYVLPDCINYFFTSNHATAFYLDDTDRRFFVHRLGNKKLDADYVSRTFRPWLDSGGYAAILDWLLHVDLTAPVMNGKPFNPFGAAPQTIARKSMIEENREDIDVWVDGLSLEGGETFRGTPGWKLATAEDLFAQFVGAYPKSRITYKSFVSRLRKCLPMVRGGNVVDLGGDTQPKRMYCPISRIRDYDGVSVETLKAAYEVGRE